VRSNGISANTGKECNEHYWARYRFCLVFVGTKGNPRFRLSGWGALTMRTKAEILTAKLAAISAELERVTREIDGLKGTDCGLTCSGCGERLETEWDFASHFVIPDERYVNLGGCPTRDSHYTTRVPVHFKVQTMLGEG
jgi:hypothetical protein